MKFPFVGPSYQLRGFRADVQRSVNLYPEMVESGTGKGEASMVHAPGLEVFSSPTGAAAIRGMIYCASVGRAFAVAGSTLWEINLSNGTATSRGTLSSSSGYVDMAENGTQLIIATGGTSSLGGDMYTLTFSGNSFAIISDTDCPDGNRVAFVDGFFIANKGGANGSRFYASVLYDGTTWDSTAYITAEGAPDRIVSLIADHRELWVFGSQSAEVYFNSGSSATNPFQRIDGAFLQTGCAAAFSVQRFDNSIMWVGRDENGSGIVWRAEGYQPRRVSTHALEQVLQGVTDLADALAWCYQQDGHTFYCLRVPSLTSTWCYDAATGAWHERADWNGSAFVQFRITHAIRTNSLNLAGGSDGKIYKILPTVYTYGTDARMIERTMPVIHNERARIAFHSFELDARVGAGIASAPTTQPTASLAYSNDGGNTYSSNITAPLGKSGEFTTRTIWRRLGMARDRVFRVRISDAVPVTIVSAEINASPAEY